MSADTFLQTLKDKDTGGERTLVFRTLVFKTSQAQAVAPGDVTMEREPVDVTVAAPTGPLGVSFVDGCTVVEASPTSPLVGKVQAGDVLACAEVKDGPRRRRGRGRGQCDPVARAMQCLMSPQTEMNVTTTRPTNDASKKTQVLASVDGVAVSYDTLLQTLKDKDTGGERTLVFKRVPVVTLTAPAAPTSTSGSTADELKKLADLHKDGALTDKEFTDAKAKLLG